MLKNFSIVMSLAMILVMPFASPAAVLPTHIVFEADAPCSITVLVTSYKDPTTLAVTSTSGSTPLLLDVYPPDPLDSSTFVTFLYPTFVVCNDGNTYKFQNASPSSPLTSGTEGASITVTGHYTKNDTTPPTLHLPADMTVEATGAAGAVVTYTATADDVNPTHPVVSCAPASGDTFGFGPTTVNCSATDAAGNTANGSFTVTVQDTTPPALTLPANITAEATGPLGAVINFSASANDTVDGSFSAACVPASDSTFPLGTTTVNCVATDTHGNTASASFTVTVMDTTSPILNLPANIIVDTTDASGTAVNFTASANDLVDGSVSVTCLPASGSTFSLGTTTVNCSAGDAHNNMATGSFNVTVALTVIVDITPPVVTVPADIVAEATGPSGAPVSFTVSANDAVDGAIVPTCSPASGSTFPLGTTPVTCTATDTHGNTGMAGFNVTVVDTIAPALNLPPNMTVDATSALGAVVSFTASATDLVDGPVAVTCSPASGSAFPFGVTTVTCSAADSHNNTAMGSFNITVVDQTPPVLNLPANMIVTALNASGAQVNFTASATDLVDGPVPVTCSPDSGSWFPIGTTSVNCSAMDSHGNQASSRFTITVQYATADVKCSGIAGHQILQPIDADGSSVFQQGSTIPAKFRVCGSDGRAIGSPDVVSSFRLIQIINNSSVINVDQAVESTSSDTVFRSGNNQWIFNISTKNLAAENTYVYLITLNDGSTIQFQFALR